MNIEFEYIEIQNFKSIGELQVFNFKELTGLNYIFGTNLDTVESRNRCTVNRHIG
jgi:hypothetical protein